MWTFLPAETVGGWGLCFHFLFRHRKFYCLSHCEFSWGSSPVHPLSLAFPSPVCSSSASALISHGWLSYLYVHHSGNYLCLQFLSPSMTLLKCFPHNAVIFCSALSLVLNSEGFWERMDSLQQPWHIVQTRHSDSVSLFIELTSNLWLWKTV